MNNHFIETRHGCICKKKYTLNDKEYTSCTTDKSHEPYCRVQQKCGINSNQKDKYGKFIWYDYCNQKRNSLIYKTKNFTTGKHFLRNNILGLLIFLVVFVLFIPYLLSKLDNKIIKLLFLVNLIPFATSLSFGYGLKMDGLTENYFQELYDPDSNLIIGYINTNIITYISLVALIYLIMSNIGYNQITSRGWLLFLYILIFIYLVPGKLVILLQKNIFNKVHQQNNKNSILYKYINIFNVLAGWCIGILMMIITNYIIIHRIGKKTMDFIYNIIKK